MLFACVGMVIFWRVTEDEQSEKEALGRQLLTADAEINRRQFTSDMLVNLARRNQSMLYRQLDIINQLEDKERDPDALADLFKLDHLATRVRRNAESLLVLAGEQTPRTWSAPVALRDVVRAAIAETEDLDRVVFAVDDRAAVSGAAVADLTHLLAELTENAVRFSPPETAVTIRARPNRRDEGGQLLTVEDWGVGMPPDDLAEANDMLAQPREVDLAVSQRLGFHVVARLAARHGITVSLSATPGSGITAVVVLPAALFTAAPVAGTGPAPIAPVRDDAGTSRAGPVHRAPPVAGARAGPARHGAEWSPPRHPGSRSRATATPGCRRSPSRPHRVPPAPVDLVVGGAAGGTRTCTARSRARTGPACPRSCRRPPGTVRRARTGSPGPARTAAARTAAARTADGADNGTAPTATNGTGPPQRHAATVTRGNGTRATGTGNGHSATGTSGNGHAGNGHGGPSATAGSMPACLGDGHGGRSTVNGAGPHGSGTDGRRAEGPSPLRAVPRARAGGHAPGAARPRRPAGTVRVRADRAPSRPCRPRPTRSAPSPPRPSRTRRPAPGRPAARPARSLRCPVLPQPRADEPSGGPGRPSHPSGGPVGRGLRRRVPQSHLAPELRHADGSRPRGHRGPHVRGRRGHARCRATRPAGWPRRRSSTPAGPSGP